MTPIEIHAQSLKQNWRVFVLVPVAIAGLYLYLGYVPFIIWVAGILVLIAVVFRLITGENKGAIIVLNDEGVFDKRLHVGVIRWEDIRRITSHDLEGARYVSLELHDKKPYEARRPLWLKLLSQVQRVHGMSSISISTNGLNIHHDDLVDLIHEGCEEVSHQNAELA
jgi:hypothetical protein